MKICRSVRVITCRGLCDSRRLSRRVIRAILPAMREGGSTTARYTAMARALETVRPRPRLFEDQYAARFLGIRLFATLAAIPPFGRAIERSIDRRFPRGHRANAVLRTRVIDDWVADVLLDGVTQVVLLGAGLDSRAYRLPAMRDVLVFEVDHPETLGVKQALVDRHVRPDHRGHVRFVSVDLLHDSLDEALRSAGFEIARTAVVWEGVTSYLDVASVDATVRWFSRNTTTGSRLIFTYLDACAIHGADGGSTELADTFRGVGEPMTFGLRPGEVAGFLADRGLELIEDLSTENAALRYLRPLGRQDLAGAFSHICVARAV